MFLIKGPFQKERIVFRTTNFLQGHVSFLGSNDS